MFLSPHIPCLLKSATLKLTKDETRLALVTCLVEPFSRELAAELGADVVLKVEQEGVSLIRGGRFSLRRWTELIAACVGFALEE